MSNIPLAREELLKIVDDLTNLRLSGSAAAPAIRAIVQKRMIRKKAVRKAPAQSAHMTPALAKKIRAFERTHRRMSMHKIGIHFNVNQRAVSHALNRVI